MEVFCFQLNIDDLTSLITYKAQLLPSALQNPVFQTVEALLESFHRIWESRICSGTIAFLDYLASKNVQTNMNTLVRTKTAEETETIGFVRRTANNRVQYNGVFCTILLPQLEVGNVCSYCSTLRKAIKDGKELPHLTSLDLHHSFCNRLTKFDEERIQHWSPFLKEYFREITFRKAKSTKPWPAAILVFSLSMYSRLGEASYEILRASLPLPSISTLNELCFKIPAKPGICYQGIAGFIQAEPYASMSLSFDEIYFTEGLQLIREEHGFRLIGMTSYGCWEKDSSLPSRYFFNFSEETDLIPDIPLDPNISPQPTIGPQLEGWNSSVTWMTEARATEILSNQQASEKPAKMALHFVLSSVSSTTVQAIGYVETFSVTAELLKALLFRIIAIINDFANRIPPNTAPQQSETVLYPANLDPWNDFRLFHQDWSVNPIQMPSLDTPLTDADRPPWMTPSLIHRNDKPRLVAIVFDGSSHARSLVNQITNSQRLARYFVHPAVPNQPIVCISDPVHLFKRFRNNIICNERIVLAPNVNQPPDFGFPDFRINPYIYTSPLTSKLYEQLITFDASSTLSISPLTRACIDLSARTKMSFPLAKKLFNPRTILSLDALETHFRGLGDLFGAYLAYTAKAVANFANRFLARLRSKFLLTGGHCFKAAEQLYQLSCNLREWSRRNENFHREIAIRFPGQNFSLPARNTSYWGFFDNNFVADMHMTLVGLSLLCSTVSEINLRLLTTDSVESFFSTIRSSSGGGGQLNIRSHRFSPRRAMIVRLKLHSYIGEMIERTQPIVYSMLSSHQLRLPSEPSASPQLFFQTARPMSVDDLAARTLNDREQIVVNYVSGWVLLTLFKKFPLHPTPQMFLQSKLHGLLRVTSEFHQLMQLLFLYCHQFFLNNKAALITKENCHQIIAHALLESQGEKLFLLFGDDSEMKSFVASKVSGLFLVDQVKQDQKVNQKSFRNSLS